MTATRTLRVSVDHVSSEVTATNASLPMTQQVELFLFQSGVTRGALSWTLETSEDGEGILSFSGPEEDVWDLARAMDLPEDDPIFGEPDGTCRHEDTTGNSDGTWECEHCGADTTAETLDRLIGTVQDYLTKASQEQAGTHAQAAATLNAAHWMHVAERAAGAIARRTGFPGRTTSTEGTAS